MNHKAPTADCSGSVAAEVDEGAFVGVREHYAVSNMARRAIEAFTSPEGCAPNAGITAAVEIARW